MSSVDSKGNRQVFSQRSKKQHSETLDLHGAAREGDVATVHLLLKAGADVNHISHSTSCDGFKPGGTALHAAIGSEQIKVVRLLLERGADVEIRDSWGRTALEMAQKEQGCKGQIAEMLANHLVTKILRRSDW